MLQKGPEQKDRLTVDLTFTASARIAWLEIIRRVTSIKQRPIKILVPGYVGQTDREGSGVFDPIRATDSTFCFYSLDHRLIPESRSIEPLILKGDIDLLLVIHYFGFVHVDLDRLKTLCSNHGVTLVEDCAHCCFMPDSEDGRSGDYSFYSLHKFFPTGSGGILRANIERPESFSLDSNDRCHIDVLEQILRTDVSAIIQKRRENYRFLEQALSNVNGVSGLWKLGTTTVPHNYPIIVHHQKREALYFHLLEKNLPTIALYYRLVDELDQELFPLSFEVASSILNLPVHQDTDRGDLMILAKEIEAFIES